MSSTVYGKDRNEPQTLSKVEKGNNLEAEYDVPASVESRSERQTFKRYKETKLGRRMRWRFVDCKESMIADADGNTNAVECEECCTRTRKRCTTRKDRANRIRKCDMALEICLSICFPKGRK